MKKKRDFLVLLFLQSCMLTLLHDDEKMIDYYTFIMNFGYSHSALATSIVRSVSLTGNSCGLGSS